MNLTLKEAVVKVAISIANRVIKLQLSSMNLNARDEARTLATLYDADPITVRVQLEKLILQQL